MLIAFWEQQYGSLGPYLFCDGESGVESQEALQWAGSNAHFSRLFVARAQNFIVLSPTPIIYFPKVCSLIICPFSLRLLYENLEVILHQLIAFLNSIKGMKI
jgi:hypothetical protein